VSLPGFLAARRYAGIGGAPARYFTLYDLETTDALASDAYKAVVAHPTEWSRSMRPHFSGVRRLACETAVRTGDGVAQSMVTVCLRGAGGVADLQKRVAVAAEAESVHGVTGLRLGRVVPNDCGSAELAREVGHGVITYVLLVDGLDRKATEAAARRFARDVELSAVIETFGLVFQYTRDDLGGRSGRRPAEEDLRARLAARDAIIP
jgi:hypothetical protein